MFFIMSSWGPVRTALQLHWLLMKFFLFASHLYLGNSMKEPQKFRVILGFEACKIPYETSIEFEAKVQKN